MRYNSVEAGITVEGLDVRADGRALAPVPRHGSREMTPGVYADVITPTVQKQAELTTVTRPQERKGPQLFTDKDIDLMRKMREAGIRSTGVGIHWGKPSGRGRRR